MKFRGLKIMDGNSFNNVCPHDLMNCYGNSSVTPMKRRFIFGIACIIFLLTVIAIIFVSSHRQEDFKNAELVYTSFKSALNVSVDPCIDFYNFSCGLWTDSSDPFDAPIVANSFSILQKKVDKIKKAVFENVSEDESLPRAVNSAIRFYKSCVTQNNSNNVGVEQLLRYFDAIGGWPILNKSKWNESLFDWFHASAFLIKNLGIHTVIGVYSIEDDKSEGGHIIYLKSPLALQDSDFIIGEPSMVMLYCIVEYLNNSTPKFEDIGKSLVRLSNITSRYANFISAPTKELNPIYLTIEELTENIPQIDWLTYFQLITNDTLNEINKPLTPDEVVAVDNLDSLRNTIAVITSDIFSKEDLANLFGWFAVKDIWVLMPDVFKNYSERSGYDHDDDLSAVSKTCFDLTSKLFFCSLDYIYVKSLPHTGVEDIIIITEYLKSAFQDVILKSNWLDDKTQKNMLKKLSNMKEVIGYPSYLNNKTQFDEIYKDYPSIVDFGLSCYIQLEQFYYKRMILSLKIPTNSTSILPRSVLDVSAYFLAYKNTLVIPLSLLNPPFYYHNDPWYLNFGAVGVTISHEIMHGFDNIGTSGVDLNVTWLSDNMRQLYKKRAMCFKDQYSVYENTGLHKNNGTHTMRENIADSEGLRIAFEAYLKHAKHIKPEYGSHSMSNYSPEQMFFISYATVWCAKYDSNTKKRLLTDSHSLLDVRVNKAISNVKQFAEIFNCPVGSPMNPINRCSIW